jgi:cyanate permease
MAAGTGEDDTGDRSENTSSNIRLGLTPNINQFLLLVLVNAFVGAMIGLEQTVIPLLGKEEFGIESNAFLLSFIASFGIVKAILNLLAGNLADGWNRKIPKWIYH